MLVRIANREVPDLIWVCPVCLGIFGRQLVFKMLEHLSYGHRGSYMSAHVLLYLLNELGKRDKI